RGSRFQVSGSTFQVRWHAHLAHVGFQARLRPRAGWHAHLAHVGFDDRKGPRAGRPCHFGREWKRRSRAGRPCHVRFYEAWGSVCSPSERRRTSRSFPSPNTKSNKRGRRRTTRRDDLRGPSVEWRPNHPNSNSIILSARPCVATPAQLCKDSPTESVTLASHFASRRLFCI